MNKFVGLLLLAASGSVFAGDVDAQGLPLTNDVNPVVMAVDTGVNSSRLDIDQDAIINRYNSLVNELDKEITQDLESRLEKEISMMIELDRQYRDRILRLSSPTYVIL